MIVAAALFAALFVSAPPTPTQAAVVKYIVNSTADTGDANPGDNKCKDSTGQCTLRAAIEEANAHTGKETVLFSGLKSTGPAPWVISPTTALPWITGPVIIDASSGTGANCKTSTLKVVLNGVAVAAGNGLAVQGPAASGSKIKGLVIIDFPGDGILIDQTSKVTVQCNLLGVAQDGVTPVSNGRDGIEIAGGATSANKNVIGGPASLRNIISGNSTHGVRITGPATGNKIQSNYIGVTRTGKAALGNGACGIQIDGATSTLVGGKTKVGNIISANIQGVCLINSSDSTVIQGNLIGVDKTGMAALGNINRGVDVSDSSGVVIGGKSPSYTNVISGNLTGISLWGGVTGSNNAKIQGNLIGVNKLGVATLGNAWDGITISAGSNNLIGGTSAPYRNMISGNGDSGVDISSITSTNNRVQGNYIGTDKSGYIGAPNGGSGILINMSSGNTIGGNSAGARNIISGNLSYGVFISDSTSGNVISGNYIGVNKAASAALANQSFGVYLAECTGCRVGGATSAGERNIISGNGDSGIYILGGSGNEIFGNYIGTNSTGKAALPNQDSGIFSTESSGNFIGSGAAGPLARNVISGNGLYGIDLNDDSADTIQGNIIGLNAAGTAAIPNESSGIMVSNSNNNQIGGVGAAYRNVISGNEGRGIILTGALTTANMIQGNTIGTNRAGTAAIGNEDGGIYVYLAPNNLIGGPNPGEGNVVSGNGRAGIQAQNSAALIFQGNIIGLNAAGTAAIANNGSGMTLNGCDAPTIGGPGANDGNVVSGNASGGIGVSGGSNLVVRGNKIGTNSAGTAAVPNNDLGLYVGSMSGAAIGGAAPADGNLISGNKGYGIDVYNTTGVSIQRNLVGTDVTGAFALGNGGYGVSLDDSPSLLNGNIVAYNKDIGIYLNGGTISGTINCLFYNLSGTGLYYNHTANSTFTGSWWGSASGPGKDYLEPGRQSVDQVGAGVVDFDPFRTTPPAGIKCPSGVELGGANRDMTLDADPADGVPDGWTPTGISVSLGEGRRSDSYNSAGYSLKMVGGGTTKVSRTVKSITIHKNDSVILGFYTRGSGITGSGLYQASVKVGSKTYTFNIPVDSGGGTGGWAHKILNFKAPADATSAVITLTYSKKYGSVWWDDVSLLDVTPTP